MSDRRPKLTVARADPRADTVPLGSHPKWAGLSERDLCAALRDRVARLAPGELARLTHIIESGILSIP